MDHQVVGDHLEVDILRVVGRLGVILVVEMHLEQELQDLVLAMVMHLDLDLLGSEVLDRDLPQVGPAPSVETLVLEMHLVDPLALAQAAGVAAQVLVLEVVEMGEAQRAQE
ncbi:MAG: hypothetical protein AB2610_20870 [Candidatus Thiodiazotropha sp.]